MAAPVGVSAPAAWACARRPPRRSPLSSRRTGTRRFPAGARRRGGRVVVEPGTDPAVVRAAGDLRADIAAVTGVTPAREDRLPGAARAFVLVGVAGRSPLLDRLAAGEDRPALAGRARGKATSSDRRPAVPRRRPGAGHRRERPARRDLRDLRAVRGHRRVALALVGRRARARKATPCSSPPGTHRFGPPSVKYRGIFLNDEDWGLAAVGGEDLRARIRRHRSEDLREGVRASAPPEGQHPLAGDARRARSRSTPSPKTSASPTQYGIVMGSSHAEPMLRDNVGEWTARARRLQLPDQPRRRAALLGAARRRRTAASRTSTRSACAASTTRPCSGPTTDAERIRTLEQHLRRPARAPRAARRIPTSRACPRCSAPTRRCSTSTAGACACRTTSPSSGPTTISATSATFATPAERRRAGGFGVYYHLSYLGRPLAYLWLCTTPPALIWEEMSKAYAHGADRIWIANVGDLKPAEIGTEFFLEMAWDARRWRPDNLAGFLPAWAARDVRTRRTRRRSRAVLAEYYRLNFQRKPEHLQWWLPRRDAAPERAHRCRGSGAPRCVLPSCGAGSKPCARGFRRTSRTPSSSWSPIPWSAPRWPTNGSSRANAATWRRPGPPMPGSPRKPVSSTRSSMAENGAASWRSSPPTASGPRCAWLRGARRPRRARRFRRPRPAPISRATPPVSRRTRRGPGAAWAVIPGLGRTGRAVAVLPGTAPSIAPGDAASAPRLDYAVAFPAAGVFTLQAHLLPTHPIAGSALRFAVALDDAPPQVVALDVGDGGPAWARGVLDGVRIAETPLDGRRAGSAHPPRLRHRSRRGPRPDRDRSWRPDPELSRSPVTFSPELCSSLSRIVVVRFLRSCCYQAVALPALARSCHNSAQA